MWFHDLPWNYQRTEPRVYILYPRNTSLRDGSLSTLQRDWPQVLEGPQRTPPSPSISPCQHPTPLPDPLIRMWTVFPITLSLMIATFVVQEAVANSSCSTILRLNEPRKRWEIIRWPGPPLLQTSVLPVLDSVCWGFSPDCCCNETEMCSLWEMPLL